MSKMKLHCHSVCVYRYTRLLLATRGTWQRDQSDAESNAIEIEVEHVARDFMSRCRK